MAACLKHATAPGTWQPQAHLLLRPSGAPYRGAVMAAGS